MMYSMMLRRLHNYLPSTSKVQYNPRCLKHDDTKKTQLPPSRKYIILKHQPAKKFYVNNRPIFPNAQNIPMPNTKMKNNIVATSHHFVKHIGLPENRVMKVEKVERPEILADIEVNETEIFTHGKSEFLKYNNSIIIFCDGCILQEKMGIGCWFGPKHPLNLSYHPNIIVPKDFGTNSDRYVFLSELLSVKMGLQRLRNSSYYNNEPVLVKTDSLNLIRSIERGYENYNFKGSFQEFVKEVQFFMERGIDVKFEFIGRIKKYENDKRSRFDMTGNRAAVSHQLQNDTLKSRKEYRPVKYGSKPAKPKDSTIEESPTEHGIMTKSDDPIL